MKEKTLQGEVQRFASALRFPRALCPVTAPVQAPLRLPSPSTFSKSLWQMSGPSTHTPRPNPRGHLQN